ncbi:MAG: hypothetical protein ACOYJC_10535 [Christensenellales bacterium]|jgi:hypothetical protein
MAIDAIGNKIMLHKATEYTRDVSHQQRQAELMQQNAHQQVQRQTQEQAMVVDDVYEAAQARIHREKEQRENAAKQQKKNQLEAKPGAIKEDALPEVAVQRQKIDIRI